MIPQKDEAEVAVELTPGSTNENYLKGYQFEQHIADRFSKTYFTVKEWRSDKRSKNHTVASSSRPDLEILFQGERSKKTFAVECKWRRTLKDGCFRLEAYQFDNYKRHQKATGQRVFIVLGVGGEPSKPDTLYVVPIDQLNGPVIYSEQLSKYKKWSDAFYYSAYGAGNLS